MEIDKLNVSSRTGAILPRIIPQQGKPAEAPSGEELQISPNALREMAADRAAAGSTDAASASIPVCRDGIIDKQGHSKKGNSGELTDVPPMPAPKAKWTVLTYMAGDNDLEEYITRNLVDMEKIGSNKGVYLVAQLDRGPNAVGYNGVNDAARYLVLRDSDHGNINSPVIQALGPTDMGKPESLKDFLAWGMKNFPAEHYLIILNDHGGGFTGALQDATNDSFMSVPEMKEALIGAEKEAGVSKDQVVLGFDACLMGQAEVAYELKDTAGILLASEEMIGGNGWPYGPILTNGKIVDRLQKLTATAQTLGICGASGLIGAGPEEVARMIIAECAKAPDSTLTMSAIDLSRMEDLSGAFDSMGSALIGIKEPAIKEYIREDIEKSQHYTVGMETSPYSEMRDAYDIALNIKKDKRIQSPKLTAAADALMKSIEDCIIGEQHRGEGMENSHGVSVYAPTSKGGYDGYNYKSLSFARDTKWDNAMMEFTGKPKPGQKPSHGYKPPVRPKNAADEKTPPVK
jgi:clostripain